MLWSLGRLEIAQDHLPAEVEFNAKMLIVACKGRHSQVCLSTLRCRRSSFFAWSVPQSVRLERCDIERIRKLAQLAQRLMIAYSITTVGRLDPDPQDGVSWACSPH